MAQLMFFDEKHIYTLNGEEVPSVSEISRFASREIYGNITQYTLDNAATRGSTVHKQTEVLDKYGEIECTPDIEPYLRAYIQFRKDFGIDEYFKIEDKLASEKMQFAGTIDRVYVIDKKFADAYKKQTKIDLSDKIGQLAIIDLKSSSVVQKVLADIQLNGYKKLAEENGLGKVGALAILHLGKDQKYKVYNFPINDMLFMSCYNLHKALEKKKKTKKEDK